MTTPFDSLAARYAELWSASPTGLGQRQQVWREIDGLFSPGQHILDLGCGIGNDALHLESLGLGVTAIDSSQQMVAIARRSGIDAHHLAIEQLSALNRTFDGAISNFGAFNCLADPALAAGDLARLLHPGAHFAMCILSRYYWREALSLNFRRWPGRTRWRGLDIHYRTSREWQHALAPHFKLLHRVWIGGGDHTLYIWIRGTN